MIDENLVRSQLSPAQESAALARRKAIYELIHPQTKQPVAGAHAANKLLGRDANDKMSLAFKAATAESVGKDKRTIERDVARGEILGHDLADLAGTSLDKGVELDALVKMPEPMRKAIIKEAMAGERVSARSICRVLTAKPEDQNPPRVASERIAEPGSGFYHDLKGAIASIRMVSKRVGRYGGIDEVMKALGTSCGAGHLTLPISYTRYVVTKELIFVFCFT